MSSEESVPQEDVRTIEETLEEIRSYLKDYIDKHLEHLIHDGLDDLVRDFKEYGPSTIDNNLNHVREQIRSSSFYIGQANTLRTVGLTGGLLKLKSQSIKSHIKRFFKYVGYGDIKVLRRLAGKAFKVINSFLNSLKLALGPAAPILDAVQQIKDHIESASTE
jgi:hypothetical protein